MHDKPQGRCSEDDVQYAAVMFSHDLTERKGHCVNLSNGAEVALFRYCGTPYAVSNICPHQHSSVICKGMVSDGCVVCPMHGWTFRLYDGKCVSGETALLDVFRVIERGGIVYVEEPAEKTPAWMNW
ncbi:hypothetical protein MASR2M18_17860 [Ignavibacteria bacterium]|jgi:NAD(P)H-dependent nitrite reductase small subunit|nr:nitrite reductase (NAD(P)H) small subunit [Bacteroidota bacterium]MCZ2133638.1 nitrite reductase (NAD(P)H) small subunit [Bacteroidota bacterium]